MHYIHQKTFALVEKLKQATATPNPAKEIKVNLISRYFTEDMLSKSPVFSFLLREEPCPLFVGKGRDWGLGAPAGSLKDERVCLCC